jgi:hypothetical protein
MPRRRTEAGAVTAELAVLLPVLLTLFLLALWSVGAVISNVRCIDAARDTARAAARGEPAQSAQSIGQRSAPANASITLTRRANDIQVTVTATHRWAGFLSIPVKAQATVQSEGEAAHAP